MNVPIELILPPLVLVAVWLYWKGQTKKRKITASKGHKDVMTQEALQELLSPDGHKLAKKSSDNDCSTSGKKKQKLRDWSPI